MRPSVSALSLTVSQERQALDELCFHLELESLVLEHGDARTLSRTTRSVNESLTAVRELSLVRAVAADRLCDELGLRPGRTLCELAAVLPDPWHTILAEHRLAMAESVTRIALLVRDARALAAVGTPC